MSDGIRNLGAVGQENPDDPFGWTFRGKAKTEWERNRLAELKTTATLSKEKWIELARMYKGRGPLEFPRAEVAYMGARVCDVVDRDLMREWLAMFQMNRPNQYTEQEMLHEANLANQSLIDVVNGGHARIIRELQHWLWVLDAPELMEQGEKL